MSDPNARNNSSEEVNNLKNKESDYTRLLRAYSQEKLKDPNTRAGFVTNLRKAGKIDKNTLKDIQQFADGKREYQDLDINSKTVTYQVLNREMGAYVVTLANRRKEVVNSILIDYDVTSTDILTASGGDIESLEEPELQQIINSEKKRKEFVESLFGTQNVPHRKTIASFLKDFNLEKKYRRVPDSKKSGFFTAVENIQLGNKISTIDVENIINSDVFTDIEQEKLLQKILPSMSLKQGKQLGIMSDAEVHAFKEQLVENILGAGVDTQESEKGFIERVKEFFGKGSVENLDITSRIEDSDIVFSTADLLQDKEARMKILDDPLVFEPFVQKYGVFIDDIQSKLESQSIKRKTDFQQKIELLSKVSRADMFQEGAVIEIEQVQKNNRGQDEKIKMYAKVSHMNDDGTFSIEERGTHNFATNSGGYNMSSQGLSVSTQSYSEFVSFIQNGNATKGITVHAVNILSEEDIKEKVRIGEIPDATKDLIVLSDIETLQEKLDAKTFDVDELRSRIVLEKERLKEELEIKRTAGENNFTDSEIQTQIEESEYIQNMQEELAELEDQKTKYQDDLGNISEINLESLRNGIKDIDSSGEQFGLKAGVSFETDKDVYVIESIDVGSGIINVKSVAKDGALEPMTYQQFYYSFKSSEAKRSSNTESFEALFEHVQSDNAFSNTWKNFVLDGNEIRKKDKNGKPTKSKVNYNYLVGEDNTELVRIEDISGGKVTISFGELKEDVKKGKDGKNETISSYSMYSNLQEMTFDISYLETFIKKHKLVPESLNQYKEAQIDDDVVDMKGEFSPFSFFFKKISLIEAIKGGQQFFEQIKEIMQQGQEEHALQFANTYLGKLLPESGRRELQVRLESSQKKRMEDYLERLKNVGSDVAIKMIKSYLYDTHGPAYQKEAAVVFMLQKYGVLNAKALQEEQGKFTWYQAFGGKPNDELYKKTKEEMEKESLPFTEEYLVYKLLKEQCRPEGYKGIKRRSKLHKEVKRYRAKGKEEEYETGLDDGGDQRSIGGRVTGAMGELKSNNYPNAVGWLEKVIDKGGPMHVMNKVPFIMAFSGIAYDFEEKTTDQLKNFTGKSRALMQLRFLSYHKDIDVMNSAILVVCKKLQSTGKSQFKTIYNEADEIFQGQRNTGVKGRIEKTEAFYDKYGKDLTNIMYMLNTGDESDTLNKMIFFEKDKPGANADEHGDNQTLKKYYDMFHEFIGEDVNFEDEELMSDAFKYAGTSGMDINRVTKQMLAMRQGGRFVKQKAGAFMAEEIIKEFSTIPHRVYSDDQNVNKEMQHTLLKDNIRRMVAAFIELHGADSYGRALQGYNATSSPFHRFNKWGIYLSDFPALEGGVDYKTLLDGSDSKYDLLLDKMATQVMNVETGNADYSRNDFNNEDRGVTGTIGDSINNIVSSSGNKKAMQDTQSNDDWDDYSESV